MLFGPASFGGVDFLTLVVGEDDGSAGVEFGALATDFEGVEVAFGDVDQGDFGLEGFDAGQDVDIGGAPDDFESLGFEGGFPEAALGG